MAVRKISGRWTVDFRFAGRRHRRVAPENTRTSARQLEARLREKLEAERVLRERCPDIDTYPTYEAFVLDWLELYAQANNRPAEQRKKSSMVRNHLIPWFGDLRPRDINERDIEEFKRDRRMLGLAPKTINNAMSILRKSLDSALDWGYVERVPRVSWLKVPKKPVEIVTEASQELLLQDETEPLWSTMIAVGLMTGMRVGEILALRWRDIDLKRNVISVNGSMDVLHERAATKNGRYRDIPINSRLAPKLRKHRPEGLPELSETFVFDRGDGRPHSVYAASAALRRTVRRLGIEEHIHWHKFRHTFATNIARSGISIRTLQALLGHSTILMTERYSHVDLSAKQEAVEVLSRDQLPFWADFGQKSMIEVRSNTTTEPGFGSVERSVPTENSLDSRSPKGNRSNDPDPEETAT